MSTGIEDDTGAQQGADGHAGDEQEPVVVAETQEVLRSPPAIIISRATAKNIAIGLFVVVLLVIFQSWQSYNQGETISALRCTVQNQSDTLDSQADSLDELVLVRKRQDRFNTLLQRLIIAQRRSDEKEIDDIIKQLDEEQRRQDVEDGVQRGPGPVGPEGPQGEPGDTPTTPTTSTTRATSTSITTTSTTRPPIVTLPTLPPIIRIASVSCEETDQKGE